MFFSSEAASASFLLPLTARDFLSYACVVAALFFIYINTSFGIIGSACVGWLCALLLLSVYKLGPVVLAVHDIILPPQEDIEGWLSEQKSVINFSFAGVSKSSDTLPLRAAANENLAIAFNITNSLTTISPSTHKFFLKTASSIINRSDRDWTVLFETARSTLIAELIRDTSQPLHLAEVTRITCLIVVLVDNFHVPSPASLPRESLVIITDQINDQWLKAKLSTKPVPSPLLSHHLSILQLALRSSDRVLKPEEILGTIMPQYETLWRVVLVTYLLAFHLYSSPTLQDRISSVPECLGTNFDEEKEALKLAKEGLRLTPSNKRIYRHTPAPNSQKVKADLELMHRHPSIWGWSALKFNPSRFDNLTKLQTEAYLPYSIRPHRCPASGGFGDRMVTCLVVAMGRVLDTATGKVDNVGYPCNAERKGVIGTARDELEGWRYTPTVYK